MPLALMLLAGGIMVSSGVPGLFLSPRSNSGQRVATVLAVLASAIGLAAVAMSVFSGSGPTLAAPWSFPVGELRFGSDALTAFFLAPVFLFGALGSIYGLGYWRQSEHPRNGRKLRLFFGVLVGSLVLLLLARDWIAFLAAWEAMALAAFFVVTTEDDREEVRDAGLLYLVATHAGTLCLFGVVGLVGAATGSFAFRPIGAGEIPAGVLAAAAVLALLGFGLKAGLVPLHVWLPSAHACSPSHVSALLSGIMIKMGVYGLVRFGSLLPPPPVAWGAGVLALGVASGVFGVAFALAQHDLKRLLAYHSIENVGIIVMGLGLALIGRSLGRADVVVLGLGGCLLHVWNHAAFKALLFLGAGSVSAAAGTREIDRMGGLMKSMPATGTLFLAGAIAISGLPPLNGFVSELLVYLGAFRTLWPAPDGSPSLSAAALAAPALAMIGALALACFVKVFGAVFLGTARSEGASAAREAGPSMIFPMIVLAACCLAIGLFPSAVAPALDAVAAEWAPEMRLGTEAALSTFAPLEWIGGLSAFVGLAAAASCVLLRRGRFRKALRVPTWDCGHARPSHRAQYTASSFAETLVRLLRFILRPSVERPSVAGIFPRPSRHRSHVDDAVLDGVLRPFLLRAERRIVAFRAGMRGGARDYLLYMLATLVLLLLAISPLPGLIRRLLSG